MVVTAGKDGLTRLVFLKAKLPKVAAAGKLTLANLVQLSKALLPMDVIPVPLAVVRLVKCLSDALDAPIPFTLSAVSGRVMDTINALPVATLVSALKSVPNIVQAERSRLTYLPAAWISVSRFRQPLLALVIIPRSICMGRG